MTPIVAVTMGDPAGIGPEIVVRALADPEVFGGCRPVVVGDVAHLVRAAGIVGLAGTSIRPVPADREALGRALRPGEIGVIEAASVPADLPFGVLSAEAGEVAYRCVVEAVRLATSGVVDAVCTAPLSKEALHAAGHRYPGHTELLAELTGTEEVSMMLATPRLKVVHVTTHVGLVDAIRRIEPGLVHRTIARGRAALLGTVPGEPRIGVCAINPHAGENGLFGQGEEEEKIVPAVERCRADGWDVTGPLAADTLFFRAARGDFDLVVAMYHDQGHGPVKVMGLEEGVNVTVGLPIVRTSVDHGTAFDIAGRGIADDRSLKAALVRAAELVARR